MESPAVVGGPLARPWIEPAAIRHQEEYGNERGMFPTGQLPLNQREVSDNAGKQAIRSGREGCPGDRRIARHWIPDGGRDRKSTRLNSSHTVISYAVFCLKKKNTGNQNYK